MGKPPHRTLRVFPPLLSLLLLQCGTERKTHPVRIGIPVWPAFEMAYLARELEAIDDSEIELVDFTSPAETLRAYRNQSIDAMTVTLDYALLNAAEDPQERIVLVIDQSLGGDAVVAKPEFSTMRSLEGKRIGLESSALGAFVLHRALESAGMTMNDVEIVPVDIPEQLETYLRGEIDALVTYDPTRSFLTDNGAQIVFDSSKTPQEIFDVLVVHKSTLSEQRDEVTRFVDAWLQAVAHFREHPRNVAASAAERQHLSPEAFLEAMERVELYGLHENAALLLGKPPPMHRHLQRHHETMLEIGTLEESFAVEPLIDGSVIEDLSRQRASRP